MGSPLSDTRPELNMLSTNVVSANAASPSGPGFAIVNDAGVVAASWAAVRPPVAPVPRKVAASIALPPCTRLGHADGVTCQMSRYSLPVTADCTPATVSGSTLRRHIGAPRHDARGRARTRARRARGAARRRARGRRAGRLDRGPGGD